LNSAGNAATISAVVEQGELGRRARNNKMKQKQPPRDFDSLQQEIQRHFERFSPHLRRIAEYALSDPSRFALQTIVQSASATGVQPSAIVRFAKLLGYPGFSAMQRVFRLRFLEVADSFHNQVREHRDAVEWTRGGDPGSILSTLAETSSAAIGQLGRDIDPAKLREAVGMLRRARTIHVLGQSQAFPVAACLAFGLLELGRRCHLLDSAAGMAPRHIASLTRNDLLVAINLADYSDAALEAVPEAYERQVPVLAISTSQTNPLARNSTLSLMVRDPALRFEPLAPYIVLVQTLVVALANKGR